MRAAMGKTLQFKVTLREIKPKVWRRIEVPGNYSFWDLHVAIQDAMGWDDCHLHVFRVKNPKSGEEEEIGIPDDDAFVGSTVVLSGWTIPIVQYFNRVGARASYDYDFGDGWQHDVVLEGVGIRSGTTTYPRCLGGAMACPPEDCGGIPGYEELRETIKDPSNPEYEDMITWLGGEFDPADFDPDQVEFDDPKQRWDGAFGGR